MWRKAASGINAYRIIGSDKCYSFGLRGNEAGAALEGWNKTIFGVCLKRDGFYA